MARASGGIPTVLHWRSGSLSIPSTSAVPDAHPGYPWCRSSRWLRTWSLAADLLQHHLWRSLPAQAAGSTPTPLRATGRGGLRAIPHAAVVPPYWINEHHQELATEEARDSGDLGGPEVQASRLDAILAFDRRTEFDRIRVPTLVVGADDDLLAPRYFSEEYVRLIPGARAYFARRGSHALTKTEANLFNRIALEFFMELTA